MKNTALGTQYWNTIIKPKLDVFLQVFGMPEHHKPKNSNELRQLAEELRGFADTFEQQANEFDSVNAQAEQAYLDSLKRSK